MAQTKPLVLVTGASGLLGRSVLAAVKADTRFRVLGTSFSRPGPDLITCDLRDEAQCVALVEKNRPDLLIHCAAERKPDVCESVASETQASTEDLNVAAVFSLARAAARCGARFVHISTDYLWDGTAAPYSEDAVLSPPNRYGHLKARAEYAALAGHPSAIILRIPVLYGPVKDWSECTISVLLESIAALPPRPLTVDDWQIRVPTCTGDIALVLVKLASALLFEGRSDIKGIVHYSAAERFTRYSLCVALADVVMNSREASGLMDLSFVTKLEGKPPGANRPYDCMLTTDKIKQLDLWVEPRAFSVGAAEMYSGLLAAGKE